MRRSWSGAALVAILAACHHEPAEEARETATVTVATVGRSTLTESVALFGHLVPPAEEDALLSAQVPGRVVKLFVREGDLVRAGDRLAAIDRQTLDEATRSAAAALEKARKDEAVREKAAALTSTLLEKGVASREERDTDVAALESARAARVEAETRLAQARRQGEWSELRAPFGGVVGPVTRHPGELVDGTAATPVLRLLGTSSLELAADATAADLARVAPGQPASVSVPGREEPLAGVVVRAARAVDPATGVGEVRVRLAVPAGPSSRVSAPLLSAATASVVVARHADALTVPAAALRRSESGDEEVVVVAGGKARVVGVKTGVRSGGLVEVVEGLKGGESVVVDSPLGLVDGTPLALRKAAATGPAS